MFDTESYQDPFWAKSGEFKRGRDPLGVQNSSISVYSRLLPGMTNLTLRLRYYGYYLWLLNEYANLPEKSPFKENVTGHYTFIRRGELILAFVMGIKYPEELSVIGSNYISTNEAKFKEDGFVDIGMGADKKNASKENNVYWDYSSGGLGQYYIGSLVGLGLVVVNHSFFTCTEKGENLATIYDQELTNISKKLLLSCITKGELLFSDIDKLQSFALNKEMNTTPEGKFYIDMLLSNDGANFTDATGNIPSQRKQTLAMFLAVIQNSSEENEWRQLPKLNYQDILSTNKDTTEAQLGWYYYYLNELCHHSLETVFWGLLFEMDGNIVTMGHLIKKVTKAVLKDFKKTYKLNSNQTLEELLAEIKEGDFDTFKQIDYIPELVKNGENLQGIATAIISFLCLYNENVSQLESLSQYATNHYLHSKRGNSLQLFQKYIELRKKRSIKGFIEKLISVLLNDHTSIAYSKMGSGTKNLLKFIVEDNLLIHIETMKPNFTNPRLRTMFNFLKDLNLIDANGAINNNGKELLDKLEAA